MVSGEWSVVSGGNAILATPTVTIERAHGTDMTGAASTYVCAALLVVTAAMHSLLGEARLIGPLLKQRDGVLASFLARFLLRAVWHIMTVCFVIIAAGLVASIGSTGPTRTVLLIGTASGIGGAGIIDAFGSRGRHVGWPLLVLIGVFALMAHLQR